MVVEQYTFNVVIPPGTLPTAPLVSAMRMPARIVRRVNWIVPPGPGGNVGFRIASNGTQQVPTNAGAWLIRDDDKQGIDLQSKVTSGSWQLIAYNTGVYAHMLEISFDVDVPGLNAAADRIQPVNIGGNP